jgi:hypothetical protein
MSSLPPSNRDATGMMETTTKLLWCRNVVISLKVMKIAKIALVEYAVGGGQGHLQVLYAESAWWRQIVWRRHRVRTNIVAGYFSFFSACVLWFGVSTST